MKTIDMLKKEVQRRSAIDTIDIITEDIAVKLKHCILSDGLIDDNYPYLNIMFDLGLAKKISGQWKFHQQEFHSVVTKKAKQLYKDLKSEGYYTK